MSALDRQEGGGHYKGLAIQPVEYVHANGIGFFEGNVIKYVTRWKDKGGIDDLKKARHYIDMLIEFETKQRAEDFDVAAARHLREFDLQMRRHQHAFRQHSKAVFDNAERHDPFVPLDPVKVF